MSDPSGEKLGKYELIKPLGAGGMAEVFLARTEGMAGFMKLLVIKRVLPELKDDLEFIEMFFDEARLAAQLSHPNICQVFDLGEAQGVPFIAMEHVPGQSLNALMLELLERQKPMPLSALLRVTSQLLEALNYAHTLVDQQGRPLNLIHRDVTPSNIMVTPQGSLKLLDFGIARAATRRHRTQAGMTVGKMGYMAPEQLRSDHLDQRVDFFGVGVTMYVMQTGRLPFDRGSPGEILRRIVQGDYVRPEQLRPDLPRELSLITQRAMAADRNERYRSALDFLADLERCASNAGLSMGPHALIDLMQRSSVGTRSQVALMPVSRPRAEPAPTVASRASPPSARPLGRPVEPIITAPNADTVDVPPVDATVVAAVIPPRLPRADVSGVVTRTTGGFGLRTVVLAALAVMVAGAVGGVLVAMRMTGEGGGLPPAVPLAQQARAVPVEPEPEPEPEPSAEPTPATPEPRTAEAVPPPNPTPAPEPVAPPAPKPAVGTRVALVAKPPAAPTPAAGPRKPPVAKPAIGATGTLKVTSGKPATIRLLGHDIGKTPLTLHLPVGTHHLELVYPGEPPVASTVTINADAETLLNGP